MAIKNLEISFAITVCLIISGCVSDPKKMETVPFDSNISLESGSFAIITSVADPELLDKLHVPRESLKSNLDHSVFRRVPTTIDGKKTIDLSASFLGVAIDGNFRIAVLPGVRKIGFQYTDTRYVDRDMILVFNAEEKHEYYAKFVEIADGGWYKINPIIYDVTEGKNVQWSVISNNPR